MLPPFEKCRNRVEIFDRKYLNSTFDEFWRYKLEVEKRGSILDPSHLDETARLLDEKLLSHRKWVLACTGIPKHSAIKEILRKVAPPYEKIRQRCLGQGTIRQVRDEMAQIYSELSGITHARFRKYESDESGALYIVGRSKVLMFIWGQTPGFDSRVIENLSRSGGAPTPILANWSINEKRYTPNEFCDIIEELDRWIVAWNEEYKGQEYKGQGITFQRLSPNRPVGRIIDIVYWLESKDCKNPQ